jgi:hypothetical protein
VFLVASVTVTNSSNPAVVDVENLDGTPRAGVSPGTAVSFKVVSGNPGGQFISCGANVSVLAMSTPADGEFTIALRCTSCPESSFGY